MGMNTIKKNLYDKVLIC